MRARATALRLALLAAGLTACAQSPAPAPTAWGKPIRVEPVTVEDALGGRAVYVVRAPFERAREVLLDFDRHADFLPSMLESEVLADHGDTGTVRFTFRGLLGIDPSVVCELSKTETADRLEVTWNRVSGDFGVSRCEGRYVLERLGRPGWTRVTQESAMAATLLSEESFRTSLRRDAEALRTEMEAR